MWQMCDGMSRNNEMGRTAKDHTFARGISSYRAEILAMKKCIPDLIPKSIDLGNLKGADWVLLSQQNCFPVIALDCQARKDLEMNATRTQMAISV